MADIAEVEKSIPAIERETLTMIEPGTRMFRKKRRYP